MPIDANSVAGSGSSIWSITAAMVAGGWLLIAVVAGTALFAARQAMRGLARSDNLLISESGRVIRDLVFMVVLTAALLTGVALAGGSIWLAWHGGDPWVWSRDRLAQVDPAVWGALGLAFGQWVLLGVVLVVLVRLLRRLLRNAAARAIAWDGLRDNDRSIERFFAGLERAVVVSAWLGFAAIGCELFGFPDWCANGLATIARIYAIVVVGLLILRATAVVVDTCEGLSRRLAERRHWLKFYEHLRPLVPLLRRCLEYALWIAIASLVLHEVPPTAKLAEYGPRLMQAIGVFFVGRLVIELGNLLIGSGMLQAEGLSDIERRRRSTIVPLARSIFRVACYFVTAIFILDALAIDTTPFLAGAGILGLVVGMGAQAVIQDAVSGFFILFENVYLVGDVIEGGGAKGTVESIEFRITRLRDADGRLHIIRNGDMKQVVNYSKEFTRAVVPFEVGYQTDLHKMFGIINECGERLRASDPDVLDMVQIDGITGFAGQVLTIRTTIKVRPGCHDAVAARWRFALKEAFDVAAGPGAARKGLVPEVQPA